MRTDFLPFCKPSITDDDIAAITEVLKSGWITTGPHNAAFEKDICSYTGAANAITIASATGGMHTVLMALGIGPGDEVITPSMTWVSTINMIALTGATPVFADIDKDTLLVTPETVAKCITPRTKLIIPVHFAGAPVDLDGIYALADQHGIRVIEDAAHAIGTFYKGRHVGSRGTAIFSFHPIKNITTGEGGVVVSDDDDLVKKVRMLKFHGLAVDAFDRKTQGRSPQAEVQTPGFKYNMTDISATLGQSQLKRLDAMNVRRRELAAAYQKQFAGLDGVIPLGVPHGYDYVHAWNLFILRIDHPRITRDRFMEELKKLNIGTGLHFRAAHTQKFFREHPVPAPGGLVNTDWNSQRICSIPFFPAMTDTDFNDVVAAVKQVIGNC